MQLCVILDHLLPGLYRMKDLNTAETSEVNELVFFFVSAAVFPFVKRKSFFGGPHSFLRR